MGRGGQHSTEGGWPGVGLVQAVAAVPRRVALLTSSKNTIPLLRNAGPLVKEGEDGTLKGLARGAGETGLKRGSAGAAKSISEILL